MKRYLNIYLLLIRLNFKRNLVNRGDFFSGLLASLAWGIFSVIAIYILSARSSSVFGWNRHELFILIGVFNILIGGLFRTITVDNFTNMNRVIQRGELDSILTKPIDSQFLVSFFEIIISGVFRILIAVGFTLYILLEANIQITFFSLLSFVFISVFGLITIYSVWFLVMTFAIWFPDLHNLSEILFAADNLTRYPPSVLYAMRILIFYIFFPLTLVVAVPTKALLHKLTSYDAALLIVVACTLLYFSRKFWKFALRYYTSASG